MKMPHQLHRVAYGRERGERERGERDRREREEREGGRERGDRETEMRLPMARLLCQFNIL